MPAPRGTLQSILRSRLRGRGRRRRTAVTSIQSSRAQFAPRPGEDCARPGETECEARPVPCPGRRPAIRRSEPRGDNSNPEPGQRVAGAAGPAPAPTAPTQARNSTAGRMRRRKNFIAPRREKKDSGLKSFQTNGILIRLCPRLGMAHYTSNRSPMLFRRRYSSTKRVNGGRRRRYRGKNADRWTNLHGSGSRAPACVEARA